MGNFKIREFRKAKGIYQDEFAAVIGLTQSNLSRYENNGIELNEKMLEKLRAKYGEEEINAFMTDSPSQVRDKEIPQSKADELAILDMVSIIKKQNDTICQQVEVQNEFAKQLTSMNSRLLDLLEKIQFD